jgi:hypothetical protein
MVLDQEEMASLMADIHIAEAVVDLDPRKYGSDSMKLMLKQSIYEAHGITAEQVDSSYAYYGRHIEDYMKVYDRTIEILTERQQEMLTASNNLVIAEGDSVNIWPLDRRFEFSHRSASRLLTFSIPADSNWHDQDVFALRFKLVTTKTPPVARMVVEYADGSSAFNVVAGRNSGFDELCVRVDSARYPQRILGYILTKPRENEVVRLDSISLVRMRGELANRFFTLRNFDYCVKREVPKDTLASDTATVPFSSKYINTGHPSHSAAPINSSHSSNGRPASSNGRSGAPVLNTSNTVVNHMTAGRSSASHGSGAAQVTNNQKATTVGTASTAQEAVRKRNAAIRNASPQK